MTQLNKTGHEEKVLRQQESMVTVNLQNLMKMTWERVGEWANIPAITLQEIAKDYKVATYNKFKKDEENCDPIKR